MPLDTVTDFIGQARYLLQDSDGLRYVDNSIVNSILNGISEMRRMRPDVFFGVTVPAISPTANLTAIPEPYRVALLDYVCGYAETSDQEGSDTGRAAMYRTRFAAQLATAGTSP